MIQILRETERTNLAKRVKLQFEVDDNKKEITSLKYQLKKLTDESAKNLVELNDFRATQPPSHNMSVLWFEMFGVHRVPTEKHTKCINCNETVRHNFRKTVLRAHTKKCCGNYTLV
jgi:hypothetical protein